MDYSGKNNRRWDANTRQWIEKPNELYQSNHGGIDTGFLAAKLIKHAFSTYPKIRIGKGTELESQQDDNKQQEVDDFYGVAPAMPVDNNPAFGNAVDTSEGVTIDPAKADVPEQGATDDDGAF